MERANGYLGTSFLPGRSFTSPADFNTQLTDWLAAVANVRRHATTRLIPAEALIADRVAMATLPPVAPATGSTVSTRLGRDYYVAIASSTLFGASRGDRPDDQRDRHPGPGPRPLRRPANRRS